MAQTAVDNEKYFGDLDAVVGDGDFGYSLARGFEIVLADWDSLRPHATSATFLRRSRSSITSRIGGTSGPIWGTAFLRAARRGRRQDRAHGDDVVAMLRAAIEGIKERGNSDLGDKTLLDALCRPSTRSSEALGGGDDAPCDRDGGGRDRAGAGRGHQDDARQARPRRATRASAASARSTPGRSPSR